MKKGFRHYFESVDADLFAIQETKMQEDQKDFHFEGYEEYWNSAEKKGYSGTLVYARHKPLDVIMGIDGAGYNDEGRIITLVYPDFYFVNVYVPNSGRFDPSGLPDGVRRGDFRHILINLIWISR